MPPTDEQPTQEHIITELRALRPTPSEEFSAELDAWAAAGFPPADRVTKGRTADRPPSPATRIERLRRLSPRRLAPAMGVAVILLALVVAISNTRDGLENEAGELGRGDSVESVEAPGGGAGGGVPPGTADRGTAQAPTGDEAAEPAPATVAPVPGPPQEELKPGKERVQERSASMTLSTEPGEVDDVADEVVDVVDRYEGIVVSSQVSTGEDRSRASFDLRIPTASLQAALADLSDLASVSSRDEGTLDITAPFVTAQERLQDAKAEVDALLEELAEADSESEIAAIRERLQIARVDLADARSELGGLKQRADFSRLSLTVVGNGDADGWSLGDALDDAVSVLEDLAGAGLVTLAVILPLGALGALIWLAAGWFRRRRREQALDR